MAKMANPNDATRMLILRYFHERNKTATSRDGKRGSCVKISVVKKELKEKFNLSQADVQSNLTYLLDKGWVKEVVKERTFSRGGANYPSNSICYEISAEGIDKLEGESEFQSTGKFRGININAVQSVVTLGDGNIVRAEFEQAGRALAELKAGVVESAELSEQQKLAIAADIDAFQGQLAKPIPDKRVLSALWDNIGKAADVGGLGALLAQVAKRIPELI
ncbi:MAG: hypothetical protein ACM3S1_13785 [Hyphomicrobiales bacterium]